MQEREYIKVLGKGIRNSLAREKVIQEYEDHIEDSINALIEKGLTLEEAEEESVRQMGNPKETAAEMNQLYQNIIEEARKKVKMHYNITKFLQFRYKCDNFEKKHKNCFSIFKK